MKNRVIFFENIWSFLALQIKKEKLKIFRKIHKNNKKILFDKKNRDGI